MMEKSGRVHPSQVLRVSVHVPAARTEHGGPSRAAPPRPSRRPTTQSDRERGDRLPNAGPVTGDREGPSHGPSRGIPWRTCRERPCGVLDGILGQNRAGGERRRPQSAVGFPVRMSPPWSSYGSYGSLAAGREDVALEPPAESPPHMLWLMHMVFCNYFN